MIRLEQDQQSLLDAALDAMNAGQLRDLIRSLILQEDEPTAMRLLRTVSNQATRDSGNWKPPPPGKQRVLEIEAFAGAMGRTGQGNPMDVDRCLDDGIHAFLARDHATARRILGALLIPIGNGEVDLGQEQLIDEVLDVDVETCCNQYITAVYMTESPEQRAQAVHAAIEDLWGIHTLDRPVHTLETTLGEPLPELREFVVHWRALVEARIDKAAPSDRDRSEDRWLREAVERTDGTEGLAELARKRQRPEDLRAWCEALVNAGDWTAARNAYAEAADRVGSGSHALGEFLDGASLAAQELGADDLETALQQAWQRAPTLPRLCRWLGHSPTPERIRSRAAIALGRLPADAGRQRALLHSLRGEFEAAATLLADAPGLEWASDDHPGHLLIPLFLTHLGSGDGSIPFPHVDDMPDRWPTGNKPRLHTPAIKTLLALAAVDAPDEKTRSVMIRGMRRAAENRIAGVTANQRRRHYPHAANLAVQCARAHTAGTGGPWLTALINRYNRHPALKRELLSAAAVEWPVSGV